ncbi:MAG: hypothetical protein ACI4NA_05445, partial [Succinivibrio sp.]
RAGGDQGVLSYPQVATKSQKMESMMKSLGPGSVPRGAPGRPGVLPARSVTAGAIFRKYGSKNAVCKPRAKIKAKFHHSGNCLIIYFLFILTLAFFETLRQYDSRC